MALVKLYKDDIYLLLDQSSFIYQLQNFASRLKLIYNIGLKVEVFSPVKRCWNNKELSHDKFKHAMGKLGMANN